MSEIYVAFTDCGSCQGKGFIRSGAGAPVQAEWQCPHCEKRSTSSSAVDHPPHYNTGKYEVIEVIEDWGLGFHAGNVVKYVARAKHKGCEIEDLKKARWYLDRLITSLDPPCADAG